MWNLAFNGVMTNLNLQLDIGPEGAAAIAEALKVNSVLTNLNLDLNNISSRGAKAIAEALRENHTVTELNISVNHNIGHAGKVAVWEAVKGRAGFKLMGVEWVW